MSSATIPAKVVREACEQYLSKVQKNRERIQNRCIEKLANRNQFPMVWRKVGMFDARHLLENDLLDTFDLIRSEYFFAGLDTDREIVVKSILNLCKVGDPITISDDQAFIFEDF